MIQLIFQKELILIEQMHQKNAIFVITGFFQINSFRYEPNLCNACHDLMQMIFNNVAIVYVKGNAYKIHFWYMSKDDAVNIISGSNLIDKKGAL